MKATATRRPTGSVGASVSKTVQRLLAQIHAEAEAATLAALSAKDGILVLHGLDRDTTRVRHRGDHINVRDQCGAEFDMWRHRHLPPQWQHCPEIHHPAWWHVYETRVDGAGRAWSGPSCIMVTDDFGTLVDVEGGAA